MPLPQRSSVLDSYNSDGFKETTYLQSHIAFPQTLTSTTRESKQDTHRHRNHALPNPITYTQQLTSFTTSLYQLLVFLTRMLIYTKPPTPLAASAPTQPLILTPSQLAIHGTITPNTKLVRFPNYKPPQLPSLTKEQNKKDLGMHPLPINWEYVVHPSRDPISTDCPCERMIQERKMPQLPLWGRPKKPIPTAYYLEQLELARPSKVNWESFYVPDPPLEYPLFQRCVMAVWTRVAMVVSKMWNAIRLTGKAAVDILRIMFACLVVSPVKMMAEIVKSIQWDMVMVSIVAAMVAKWLPGWTGEVLIEEEAKRPLYTILIAGGRSIGTGPVPQTP